jgi:hypothetical protein
MERGAEPRADEGRDVCTSRADGGQARLRGHLCGPNEPGTDGVRASMCGRARDVTEWRLFYGWRKRVSRRCCDHGSRPTRDTRIYSAFNRDVGPCAHKHRDEGCDGWHAQRARGGTPVTDGSRDTCQRPQSVSTMDAGCRCTDATVSTGKLSDVSAWTLGGSEW